MGYTGGEAYENFWGLFAANGTPKQAAVALRNLLSIISDDSPSFPPDALSYQIRGLPSNGHTLLLQKSDRTFILILWIEADLHDVSGLKTAVPQKIVITFWSPHFVDTYDPMLNAVALAGSRTFVADVSNLGHLAHTHSSCLQVFVSDHPILVTVSNELKSVGPPANSTSPAGKSHGETQK